MPPSPLPAERSRAPVSTPGGILIVVLEVRSRRPAPWHARHGFSTTRPAPSHRGHVCAMLKIPRELITCPRPPQVEHVFEVEPGSAPAPRPDSQQSRIVTSFSFSPSNPASANVIHTPYR